MRVWMMVLAAMLVASVAQVGCSTQTMKAQPQAMAAVDDEIIVPDRTLLFGIADRAQAIRETGRPTSAQELAKQLDRTSCRAILPEPMMGEKDLSPEEVYRLRAHSVLVLASIGTCKDEHCRWPGHAVVNSCATAFVIGDDGLCVSNYHVFDDPKDDETKVVATALGVVYEVREVLAANRTHDVAIFRIDTRGDALEPITLRTGAAVGSPVTVISHPERRFYTLSSGIVSRRSVRRGALVGDHRSRRAPPMSTPPEMPLDAPDPRRVTPALEITAEYALGSSGGPVLDSWGNAVGMVCATHTLYAQPEAKEDPQSVVRTCVPAESILALIKAP